MLCNCYLILWWAIAAGAVGLQLLNVTEHVGMNDQLSDDIMSLLDFSNAVRLRPDLLDTGWLTVNTIKDLAEYPSDRKVPIVNISTSNIPGVKIMAEVPGKHVLEAHYFMVALQSCYSKLVEVAILTDISPTCRFGHSPRPHSRTIEEPLGTIQFIESKLTQREGQSDLLLANDTYSESFTAPQDTETASSTGTTTLDTMNLRVPARYTTSLKFSSNKDDISPTQIILTICELINLMARRTLLERHTLLRRPIQLFMPRTGSGAVIVNLSARNSSDQPNYDACVNGIISVIWKMRYLRRYGSAKFKIWRVSDQKPIIDGAIEAMKSGMEVGRTNLTDIN